MSVEFQAIKRLPANQLGRDFVVGDLHGCLDLLHELLNEVSFDRSKDRLFSVGDIVDRGPSSFQALHLLNEPWFYAVRGNHEDLLLGSFVKYRETRCTDDCDDDHLGILIRNGGIWVLDHFDDVTKTMTDEFDAVLEKLVELPVMFVVGEWPDRFHVLHAELFAPRQDAFLTDADIDRYGDALFKDENRMERALWGRSIMDMRPSELENLPTSIEGLSPIYCGHTIKSRVRRVLSHVNLDTGAFRSGLFPDTSYGLTLIEARSDQLWQASYPERAEDLAMG